jgi:spermidine/putrescine transport system ATP-binding protein
MSKHNSDSDMNIDTDEQPRAIDLAEHPERSPVITFKGVSKRYGRHLVLRRMDLEIGDGEFFCLLGPSGCGKTTTLNLLGGFVAPTEGEIHISGSRIDQLPPNKRDVNTVFQSYALFPNMTVKDNIGFGLKMAGVSRAEARELVESTVRLVGLDQHADRLPNQLSGGQQQRVAVARAIINRPAVLLLDEPLGALDLKMRRRLQVELANLHREVGMAFMYVTHDQEEAMALADRIAVMRDGRIEQIGTPTQIYSKPVSRFVADFIGESNFFELAREGAAAGQALLRTGERVPCADPSLNKQDAATLMVRPEWIALAANPEEAKGLEGTVLHTSFLGSRARVTVSCAASDHPVVAEIAGRELLDAEHLAPGSQVWMSWEPEMATVLPNEAQK